MAKTLICYLEKICTSQFQITPNIRIQVTATEKLFQFLSNLTLYQPWNGNGKVTHMDEILTMNNNCKHDPT